jgi:hypothetical protein
LAGRGVSGFPPRRSSAGDEALELFVDRQMAELMVENWDRDEPNRAGELPSSRSNLRP